MKKLWSILIVFFVVAVAQGQTKKHKHNHIEKHHYRKEAKEMKKKVQVELKKNPQKTKKTQNARVLGLSSATCEISRKCYYIGIMKNKKEILIGSAGVVALVLVAGFILASKHKKVEESYITPHEETALETVAKPKQSYRGAPVAVAAGPEATPQVPLSYDEAYVRFVSGHLVQFDLNCQAHPRTMSIVNGATLMLDNRSSKDQVITMGQTTIALPGYGFKIVKVQAPTVPTTYRMSCLDSMNVNTITVQ